MATLRSSADVHKCARSASLLEHGLTKDGAFSFQDRGSTAALIGASYHESFEGVRP